MRRKHLRFLFLLIYSFCACASYANFNTLSSTVTDNSSNQPNKLVEPLNSSQKQSNIIIVDMGSTGSRMHAFSMQKPPEKTKNSILVLNEIALSKNDPNDRSILGHAVADYINSPNKISEHILPLYTNLAKQLQNLSIDINKTPIYFYATGGMRLHEHSKQQELHRNIKKLIIAAGHDKDSIISQTITGELEGIFAWLSVNYKLQTLQNNLPTLAALDMGGASTQVALEYNAKSVPKENLKNLFKLKFNNKNYLVYSKSILGYGLTQTKLNISNYNQKQAMQECHLHSQTSPKHQKKYKHSLGNDLNLQPNNDKSVNSTDFNYSNCSKLIALFLKNKKEHIGISKAIKSAVQNNMKFVAASGYYHNFNFFNSKLPEDLIKSIPDSCHLHRENFRSKFPNLTEEELNETCFDATYLKILLNHAYHMPDGYHNFTIPKHDIDWTIGAALFIATNQMTLQKK